MDLVTEYLKLGLRFDRVVDGFVDAYTGDPALQQQVADEPAPDPADLSRQAAALSAEVPNTEPLHAPGPAFLTAHLDALAVAGRRLAGEQMSFIDEVQSYFQVRIGEIDTEVYAAAHQQISALLGGSGPLDRAARRRPGRRDLPAGAGRAGGPDRCRRTPGTGHRADRARRPARAHRLRDRP